MKSLVSDFILIICATLSLQSCEKNSHTDELQSTPNPQRVAVCRDSVIVKVKIGSAFESHFADLGCTSLVPWSTEISEYRERKESTYVRQFDATIGKLKGSDLDIYVRAAWQGLSDSTVYGLPLDEFDRQWRQLGTGNFIQPSYINTRNGAYWIIADYDYSLGEFAFRDPHASVTSNISFAPDEDMFFRSRIYLDFSYEGLFYNVMNSAGGRKIIVDSVAGQLKINGAQFRLRS